MIPRSKIFGNQTILNWIQYKLASIKGAFSGETRAESFLRNAERYYIRAFATTGINPAARNVQHMITGPAGISRAAALGWDIDKWDGADGFERMYLSDKDAKINFNRIKESATKMIAGFQGPIALSEILTHPTLFSLYPELSEYGVLVEWVSPETGIIARHDGENRLILINANGPARDDGFAFSDALMHELQHAVQHVEQNAQAGYPSGSSLESSYAYIVASELQRVANEVERGSLTQEQAVADAASVIRLAVPSPNHVYRSSAVYEAYRSDLGEQEAYSTGTGYADLSVGALEDSELSDEARSLHNLTPPIISGNIPDSYAIIQSALENLGYLGIDNLRSKAQDETITANERVILDAAEYVERKAKAWSVVGGVSDKKHRGNDVEPEVAARKDPRRGAIVLEQDESSVSPFSPDDGGISGRTAHRTQRSLLGAGSQSRPSGTPSSEVADKERTTPPATGERAATDKGLSTPPGASSISEEALAATPLSEVVDSFRADPANEESVAALRKRIELAPIDEVLGLPVFKDAISASAYSAADETNRIHTPEREALRDAWKNRLSESGSYSEKTVDGRKVKGYDGVVKNEGIAFIIIGPSAAGKSTIADPISQNYSARIYDSDVVKQMIPEFDDGYGAGRVHEESSEVMFDAFHRDAGTRVNMVIPIVGGKESSVMKYKYVLDANGYKTYLVLNELDSEKAAKRAAARFLTTGRFVDPQMVYNQLDNPTKVFQALEQKGDFNGYEHYSNDVEFGQSPVLVSGTGEIAGIGNDSQTPQNAGRHGDVGKETSASNDARRTGENRQGAARSVEAHLPKRLSSGPKYYGTEKRFQWIRTLQQRRRIWTITGPRQRNRRNRRNWWRCGSRKWGRTGRPNGFARWCGA